jgi:hypothetical protein
MVEMVEMVEMGADCPALGRGTIEGADPCP